MDFSLVWVCSLSISANTKLGNSEDVPDLSSCTFLLPPFPLLCFRVVFHMTSSLPTIVIELCRKAIKWNSFKVLIVHFFSKYVTLISTKYTLEEIIANLKCIFRTKLCEAILFLERVSGLPIRSVLLLTYNSCRVYEAIAVIFFPSL